MIFQVTRTKNMQYQRLIHLRPALEFPEMMAAMTKSGRMACAIHFEQASTVSQATYGLATWVRTIGRRLIFNSRVVPAPRITAGAIAKVTLRLQLAASARFARR